MSVTPSQIDELMRATGQTGSAPAPTAPPDSSDPNATLNAAINSAPKADSSNTAVSQPFGGFGSKYSPQERTFTGSFSDKLGSAAAKLVKAGMPPMPALVAGGLHALSTGNAPQSDAPSGGANWDQVLANKDQSVPTTPSPQEPSNGRKIINGIEGGLGDLAAATEGGTSGGGIAGAARVAAATSARHRMEQDNRIKVATANAQMLHEQMLVHKLGQEEVDKSAAAGMQSLNEMMTAPNAEILASNKTSDDLKRMIDSKAIDPTRDAVFVTGNKVVGNDSNGLPITRTVYSVVKPGGRIAPSSAGIDFLNKYLPGSDFKKPEEDGQGGQTFDSHTYYWLNQRAMNNMAAVQTIQKMSDENEERAHKIALEKGNDAFVSNDAIRHAFSTVPSVGNYDPFLAVKAYGVLQREVSGPNGDEILKTLPKNWAEQFAYTYGGGEPKKFEDQLNKFSQLQEKLQDAQGGVIHAYTEDPAKYEGKTAGIVTAANAVLGDQSGKYSDDQKLQAQAAKNMAIDQAKEEARQKGEEARARDQAKEDVDNKGTNGSTETGDSFLDTLDVARRRVVMGYVNGLSTWTPRLGGSKYGQGLLRDIRQYMGNWDETKAPAYADMRKNFTTGKESVALTSANTAMHHIGNMWNHLEEGATAGWSGSLEQFVGGNEQGRRLADDAKAVASELGRLYTGGVIGQHDQEEWSAKLDPKSFGMTADKLRTNIREFVELLGGRLEASQAKWDNGAPAQGLDFDMGIISPDNADAYRKITGKNIDVTNIKRKPKYNDTPAAAQAQRPNGNSQPQAQNAGGVIFAVPDGKGGTVSMSFKDQSTLDKFKLAHGLK